MSAVGPEVARDLATSGYGARGFAERYDDHRPSPPPALLQLVRTLAGAEPPRLVVDLGSGTGLSTRPWAGHAEDVLGVEPNAAMLRLAQARTAAPNVRYAHAAAQATGVADAAATIVTASQSLQWMEPAPTFAEVARILRPGGIFAAYQYESLLTPFFEPEQAWACVRKRVRVERERRDLDRGKRRWPVSLEGLREAGCFVHCREIALGGVEEGDAERLVGFALSEGSMTTLLEAGASEAELGLDRLREVAGATIGATPCPWFIGYRAWIGVRRLDT